MVIYVAIRGLVVGACRIQKPRLLAVILRAVLYAHPGLVIPPFKFRHCGRRGALSYHRLFVGNSVDFCPLRVRFTEHAA